MNGEVVCYRRQEFPILKQKTYLASHSLGAVPRGAAEALNEYYELWASQGINAWDGPWWQAVGDFTGAIERLLNAPEASIAPMLNASAGMAAIAQSFRFDGPRRRIVITELEFTTSYPLWHGCKELGAEIVIVRSDDGISVPLERLLEAIDEQTLLVAVSHVIYSSGAIQDLRAVVEVAHKNGAAVLGDGYHAAGTIPVDLAELEVDFYVGGCHKWLCGGPGAGFLYVRPEWIPRLRPRFAGWFALKDPFQYDLDRHEPELADGVWRFLGGTVNIPAFFAARTGLAIIEELGIDAIRAHHKHLTTLAVESGLERGFTLRSPADADLRSGMVCFDFEKSQQVVQQLLEQQVIVDWRLDCGMRFSAHFYNEPEDLERLFSAIDALR